MKLSAIVDFYLLERLHYEANYVNVPFDNQESYDVKREVLRSEINAEYNRLTHDLALAFRDYCWLASFGEARHAWCKVSDHARISPDIPRYKDNDRSSAMRHGVDYTPDNTENIKRLSDCFSQEWNTSSFGGQKWAVIVEACNKYNVWPNAVFIDYCMDLEHNGGCMFNKSDVKYYLDLTLNSDLVYRLRSFLDQKRDADNIIFELSNDYAKYASAAVRALILRWYDRAVSPRWMSTCSAYVTQYTYNPCHFGDKVLSGEYIPAAVVKREDVHNSYTHVPKRNYRSDRTHSYCYHCERKTRIDRLYRGSDNHNHHYCQTCFDRYFFYCHHCSSVVSVDNGYRSEVSDYSYCQSCYDDLFSYCSHCESDCWADDMHQVDDENYCPDCYDHLPKCQCCKEHADQLVDDTLIQKWCITCQHVEYWCNDCMRDDHGFWVTSNGHELTELPACLCVPAGQLGFETVLGYH